MELTVWGSSYCQDTLYGLLKVKDSIKNNSVKIILNNISTNMPVLKEFMNNRENNPIYKPVKENNGIGMPYFVFEDGTETLNLEEALEKIAIENEKAAK